MLPNKNKNCRERQMKITKDYRTSLAAISVAAFLFAAPSLALAQSPTIGATDIGGVVTGRADRKPASG